MIQLRPYRFKEFRLAGIEISSCNEELLHECAYYPRPRSFSGESACQLCSFHSPNTKCRFSHILTDTQTGVVQRRVDSHSPVKKRDIFKGLSKEIKREILGMEEEELRGLIGELKRRYRR